MDSTIYVLCKDYSEMIQFESVQEGQKWLEKIDVENREYFCWDSFGNVLKLGVKNEKYWLYIELGSNEEKKELNNYIIKNNINKLINSIYPKI